MAARSPTPPPSTSRPMAGRRLPTPPAATTTSPSLVRQVVTKVVNGPVCAGMFTDPARDGARLNALSPSMGYARCSRQHCRERLSQALLGERVATKELGPVG